MRTTAVKATIETTKYPWSPREIEFDLLHALWSEHGPLTPHQLQAKTGIPCQYLTDALATLCASGRLSRLNTIIESYAVPGC